MIGLRIARESRPPYVAYGGLVLGALLLAFSLRVHELAIAALLPVALGFALLLNPQRRFLARFTPTALEVARPSQSIPYAKLLEVHPLCAVDKPRPPAFPIWVVHSGGCLTIPAPLTSASERVYVFLRGQLRDREGTGRELPETLERYRREQEQSFGAERVFGYCGRRGVPARQSVEPAIGYGLLATGVLWTLLGLVRRDSTGWMVGGILVFLVGAVILVSDWQQKWQAARAKPRAAALVISPLGLALQQDALTGHLAWKDIRKVSTRTGREALQTSRRSIPAVVLEVEGAAIDIADAYDRPLAEIREQILRYWR
jgi:hypothetical protein